MNHKGAQRYSPFYEKIYNRKRKTHYSVFFTFIGGFLLVDSYLVSLKLKPEVVLERSSSRTRSFTKIYQTYKIVTSSKERSVTKSVFESISIGDTVFVGVSTITNAVQKITTSYYGKNSTYNIGFINSDVGIIFLFIALVFILVYVILSLSKIVFDNTTTVIVYASFIVFVLYHHLTF